MGRSVEDERALIDAAYRGDAARVRELLVSGADPNRSLTIPAGSTLTAASQSPLYAAIRSGSLECVRLLVAAGASIVEHDAAESLLAAAPSHAMVELLLAEGANPTAPSIFASSVVAAVAKNDAMSVDERASVLRMLVDHGADLDAPTPHLTALWGIACNADVEAVEALLQAGADPRTDPSALAGAVWGSYPGQSGASPDAIERTIDLLVGAGCDVNERDGNGLQPLHGALMPYSHGVGFQSSDGLNAPAAAALIRHGAAIDIVFPSAGCALDGGVRPLHVAAAESDPLAIRLLLASGADPRERAPEGRTALDIARAAVARAEGATVAPVDHTGRARSPEDIARFEAYHRGRAEAARECVRLLEAATPRS